MQYVFTSEKVVNVFNTHFVQLKCYTESAAGVISYNQQYGTIYRIQLQSFCQSRSTHGIKKPLNCQQEIGLDFRSQESFTLGSKLPG